MAYYDDIKDKKAPFESHYISAYGLAVKHGYDGTEEEWVKEYDIAREEVLANKEKAEAAQKGAEASQAAAYSDAEYVGNMFSNILGIQSSIEVNKNTAVAARKEAVSARDEAIAAQAGAVSAENNAEGAEERINETVTIFNEAYGDFSLQAEKAKEHYDSSSNPHEVTAEQVGAYTKEEVDELIDNADVDLSGYAKKDEVFKTDLFGWTDFGNYLSGANGFIGTVYYDRIIIDKAVDDEFVIIECDGNTLGFSFSISGYSDAILRINGEVKRYINSTKDGSVFATDTIPFTAVTGGIYFVGNNNTWTFTDMKRQSVQGVSELEVKLGDIDTALDAILDIQNGLIGGDV